MELGEILNDEVETILDKFQQGNWVVKILPSSKSNFQKHIAILNLYLDNKNKSETLNNVLKEVNAYFLKNHGTSEFEIKNINNHIFIEGHFNI